MDTTQEKANYIYSFDDALNALYIKSPLISASLRSLKVAYISFLDSCESHGDRLLAQVALPWVLNTFSVDTGYFWYYHTESETLLYEYIASDSLRDFISRHLIAC